MQEFRLSIPITGLIIVPVTAESIDKIIVIPVEPKTFN